MNVYSSWSGGKDSALALHRARLEGARPDLLITMMTEAGDRSRSHGLRRSLLEAQADALGLPILFESATWAEYESRFEKLVAAAVARGPRVGVHGDIDIESHREWVETVSARAGASTLLPLWKSGREALMHELLDAGFRAMIVAVRDGVLPPEMLGTTISEATLDEFAAAGVDLAGENGEYHTLVVDGPLFVRPLPVETGEVVLRDGVWFVDVETAQAVQSDQSDQAQS